MNPVEFTPEFVDAMPSELKQGVIYICKKYGISGHLCACGCGGKTILDLKPVWENGWSMTEKDGKVSFSPSIGNFTGENPYHAHYVITDNIANFV